MVSLASNVIHAEELAVFVKGERKFTDLVMPGILSFIAKKNVIPVQQANRLAAIKTNLVPVMAGTGCLVPWTAVVCVQRQIVEVVIIGTMILLMIKMFPESFNSIVHLVELDIMPMDLLNTKAVTG